MNFWNYENLNQTCFGQINKCFKLFWPVPKACYSSKQKLRKTVKGDANTPMYNEKDHPINYFLWNINDLYFKMPTVIL